MPFVANGGLLTALQALGGVVPRMQILRGGTGFVGRTRSIFRLAAYVELDDYKPFVAGFLPSQKRRTSVIASDAWRSRTNIEPSLALPGLLCRSAPRNNGIRRMGKSAVWGFRYHAQILYLEKVFVRAMSYR